MLEIKDKGVFQVVEHTHLRLWCDSGWRLVAVLEEQDTKPVLEMLSTPMLHQGGVFQQHQQERHVPITVSRYLLVLDEDTVIMSLRDELKTAQERLGKESQDFDAFKKKAEGSIKEHEALKREHHEICQGYQRIDKEFKEYRAEAELKSKADADKLKEAATAIEKYATIRKTAYERILEGEFDERVEGIEAGDFGDRRDPVADVPQGSGLHPQ